MPQALIRARIKKIFSFLAYGILLLVFVLILSLVSLAFSFSDLKNAAYQAYSGKAELEQAVVNIKSGKLSDASSYAEKAQIAFSSSIASLDKVEKNPAARFIPIIRHQFEDIEYLARTGEVVSRSIQKAVPIVSGFYEALGGKNNFSSLSEIEKQAFLKLLYEAEPELQGLQANLELALLDVNKIRKIGVLFFLRNQIVDLKTELEGGLDLISRIPAMSKILPALAGYPESGKFLIIMQNNDELRPSGGFIGLFGLMETKGGEIVSLTTHDSYHLDMPAYLSPNWTKTAPAPLAKYLEVEKWYLRDANWSPDWPTSANNILEIYNGEKIAIGEAADNFNGVIAINPDFIAELIDLTGPVVVRGETYTSQNFQELLQYNVEMAYKEQDISSWDRKEVVGDIVSALKNNLFSLPSSRFSEFVNIISRHVENRNIQLYFTNNRLQDLAISSGLAGEIKSEPLSDYLSVVDANLGAFKSDAVVDKNFSYEVSKEKSFLRLDYKHNGGFDWRTTRYRSYTRVYVPRGSSLQKLEAYGRANLEEASIISYDDEKLNKTVFAFFFSLEPGTSGGLELNYSLPNDLSQSIKDDNYQLLAQKQSGQRLQNFNFRLLSGKKVIKEGNYQLKNEMIIK